MWRWTRATSLNIFLVKSSLTSSSGVKKRRNRPVWFFIELLYYVWGCNHIFGKWLSLLFWFLWTRNTRWREEKSLLALKNISVILSKLVKILLEMRIFITLSSNSLTRLMNKRRSKGRETLIKKFVLSLKMLSFVLSRWAFEGPIFVACWSFRAIWTNQRGK